MHILLTRPRIESDALAGQLEAAGHTICIEPVIEIVILPNVPEAKIYSALFATSANAFTAVQETPEIFEPLKPCPLFVVGERTGEAARAGGFSEPVLVAPNVRALLEKGAWDAIAGTCLYLAGRQRKPDLERGLQQAGVALEICETYDAVAAQGFSPQLVAALQAGGIDAVMHFSRRSAEIFSLLVKAAGLEQVAAPVRHLCLSGDVAQGLSASLRDTVIVAKTPDAQQMLALAAGLRGQE